MDPNGTIFRDWVLSQQVCGRYPTAVDDSHIRIALDTAIAEVNIYPPFDEGFEIAEYRVTRIIDGESIFFLHVLLDDLDRAKELFEEAGWKEDDTFRILVDSDANDYYAEAQVIQEELRGIGINCEVLAYDSDTYRDIRNNKPGEWDAFITGFGPKVLPNMNLFLSATWAGKCTDERIQSDLAAIAAESELADAQQIWYDLQAYMYGEYVPVVLFGTTQRVGVCTSDLTGALMKERMVWVNVHPVEG
jgi:ABC-type transport system substrate-binding protein